MPSITEFRKLSPNDQLRRIRGEKLSRVLKFERNSVNEDKRTVWLSIASDRPYERWWGIEILDHNKRSIRDERLRSGAPLLVGHDATDQVGVIEDFQITSDGKLRVLARFSNSTRAQEIWRDVVDGIRRNASVGYLIHDLVLESEEEDVPTYRVTDWEPFEGSLVAVPADPSVGVGRSHSGERIMPEEHKSRSEERSDNRNAERIAGLIAAGKTYKDFGGIEVALQLIDNPNATLETFNQRILSNMSANPRRPLATAEPAYFPDSPITTPRRSMLSSATLRAFGENRQQVEANLYSSGQWLLAKLAGNKRAAQWCVERGLMARDMSEGIGTAGGYLVPDVLSNAIIDFTAEFGVARQEVRVVPMSSDSLNVPVRKTGLVSYYIGEGATITKSNMTWGSVGLLAKKLAVLNAMSSEVLDDAVIDLAAWISMEAARSFAEAEDAAWLNGDGTSTYGGMTGVRTQIIDGSHNAGKVTAGTNVDSFAEITTGDLDNVVAKLPSQALKRAKWYCSQAAYALVFQRVIEAAGGITLADLVGGPIKKGYLGYPIVISDKMPAGSATDYSGEVMLLFGDMTQACLMGTRREISVKVDASIYLESDQIAVQATERFHIVAHQLGDNTNAGAVVGLVGN